MPNSKTARNQSASDSLLSPLLWSQLSLLRHTLHASPELSSEEGRTAAIVTDFLAGYAPDALLTGLGGHGVAAVFEGPAPGPTILVRCELDALPMDHADDVAVAGVGAVHRCGHDGHMSIVAGLAPVLSFRRPARGRVVLAFQPAEETGLGASALLADPRASPIRPDAAIALHNMPGFALSSVVFRPGTMACASVGMELSLAGRASHAAEPDKAVCPSRTLSRLLVELPALAGDASEGVLSMATVTHAQMGDLTFGVTPGYARLRVTLRSDSTEGLRRLSESAQDLAVRVARQAGLRAEVSWHDQFPATHNCPNLTRVLEEICGADGLPTCPLEHPMRWSDDFGHFGEWCPILYFGLGIGEDASGLHQPGYAFPDEAIATGVGLFLRLTRRIAEELPAARVAQAPDAP